MKYIVVLLPCLHFSIAKNYPTSPYPKASTPYPNVTNHNPTSTDTTSPSTTYNPPSCPEGWIDGGYLGCFYFDSEERSLNWVDAQAACEKLGGYLAEIKTEQQNNFIESMALVEESFTGVRSWWLGLSDMGHEGRWMWGHSVADAEFTSWAPGHPNTVPSNQDDCVKISHSEQFLWKDISCIETHHISPSPICQRDVESFTTTAPSTTPFQDTTTAYSFHVELRDGNAPGEGNVYAVNSKNELGPVCDDIWDNIHAVIVCRQLGYTNGIATIGSYFGSVSSNFAMDDVSCIGEEAHIQDCQYVTSDDCGVSEGAGVKCNN